MQFFVQETIERIIAKSCPRQSHNNFFPNNKLRSHHSIGMVLAQKGTVEMRGVLRKMKILVVDDANFMRTIVKDTLAPNGFEIVGEATNGSEAVAKYAELRPDLVTMDITMKVKDGLEAAREILAADPNARIVMVTALGQEKMLLDSIALGVRDFVVKPFTKERILSAVEKALYEAGKGESSW